jgi:hypothetical protein
MANFIRSLMIASSLVVIPAAVLAQQRPQPAPAQTTQPAQQPARPATPAAADAAEIKLDESTTLRAAALEARISAVLANFALLQRQAQDLQQEMTKMLEERKTLIQDAGKKVPVDVKDPNEWAFDNTGQRYLKVRRPQ